MLSSIRLKIGLLCFVVFVILYSFAVYQLQSTQDANNDKLLNKNLLNYGYQVFYGKESENKKSNEISLKLDSIGEVAVLFDTKVFSADDYSVLDLVIDNLPINYRAFLVWQTKKDNEIYQIELFQPNGNIKTNLLSRNPNWNGDIVYFGIRIAPQTHLGLSIPYDKDIVFKHTELRKANLKKDYFMLFDYWMQYDPLSYIIVNRVEANQMLPFYAQPFLLILAWFLICLVMIRIIFKKNYFLTLIILSWLFLEVFQINNMTKVTKWTSNVYANDMKINVDQQLYDIAMRVKSILKLDLNNSEKLKQTKVLVLSSDKYQRARIIYHMLPVNSSFLDINLEVITQSRVSPGDYIMSMSLNGKPKRPVNGQLIFPRKTIHVKEVWHDEIVSVMEVL